MKILLVTSRWPWPPRRGDQVRAVQLLAALGAEHEVTLLAPAPPEGEGSPSPDRDGSRGAAPFRIEPYRTGRWATVGGALRAVWRGLPLQCIPFDQPDLGRRLRRLAPAADLVVLQLVRLAPHLADVGAAPLAVDLIDCLSLNAATRARFDRPWLRPALAREARRVGRWERRLIERSRLALVVSGRDRAALVDRLALPPDVAARLAVVPVGVEAVAGSPAEGTRPGPPVLAFTGNLGYFPNADGVTWWLGAVWPALAPLRERPPGLALVVAGDRPPRRVRRAAAAAGPEVELLASPPDLGAVLARATVALAPLRCGSGVPIKVLEGWAAGVPVVASRWAAAGTTGRPGEDLLVADGPAEWRDALAALLADPALRRRLAAAGRARLAADYRPAAAGERLRGLVRGLESPAAARPPRP